jgi:hypothetical protein
MKIKIIVPETGIQITKHVIVHAGDVVDLPFHQAEHLIRLNQAIALGPEAFPVPDAPDLGLLPPTTAEL